MNNSWKFVLKEKPAKGVKVCKGICVCVLSAVPLHVLSRQRAARQNPMFN